MISDVFLWFPKFKTFETEALISPDAKECAHFAGFPHLVVGESPKQVVAYLEDDFAPNKAQNTANEQNKYFCFFFVFYILIVFLGGFNYSQMAN